MALPNLPLAHSTERGAVFAVPRWRDWVELAKPGIALFTGLTAMAGWFAAKNAGSDMAALAVVGTAAMLAAAGAAAVNHATDIEIDRRMPRTRGRPLPAGRMGVKTALAYGIALVIAGLALAAELLGFWPAFWLGGGVASYALLYSLWLKPRHWVAVPVGGLAGSFAVLAGAAAAGSVQTPAVWWLAAALFFWSPAHYWALAARRSADFAAARIPILSGRVSARTLAIVVAVHVIATGLCMAWAAAQIGPWSLGAAGAASVVFAWPTWLWLRTPHDPAAAGRVFAASLAVLPILYIGLIVQP